VFLVVLVAHKFANDLKTSHAAQARGFENDVAMARIHDSFLSLNKIAVGSTIET